MRRCRHRAMIMKGGLSEEKKCIGSLMPMAQLKLSYPTTAALHHHHHPQQQRRNYHENIVEHYENPRNVGSLDKNSDDVGTVSFLFIY
jgi:hypothetical protein